MYILIPANLRHTTGKIRILKIIFIIALTFVCVFLRAQQIDTSAGRYYAYKFASVDTFSNVVYGAAADYQGNMLNLKMDVYQPAGDPVAMRPLIIFAHGGSFVSGSKTDADVRELCIRFARTGYVTASIDYRLGVSGIDSINAAKAVIRAMQDMKAAVRYFRQDATTANTYRIHPGYIFIGGSSAGAITALSYAYMNNPSEIPYNIDVSSMGGMEGQSGNTGFSTQVNAVVNLCGALGDSMMVAANDVPFVSVHGYYDQTVPYYRGYVKVANIPLLRVDGSGVLHTRAGHLAVNNALRSFYTGHVPYKGTSPTQIAYMDTTFDFVKTFLRPYLRGNTTGLNQLWENTTPEARVFPNPSSSGFVQVNLPSEIKGSYQLQLFDVSGRLVYQHCTSVASVRLEQGSLPDGLYLLHINGNHGYRHADKVLFNQIVLNTD